MSSKTEILERIRSHRLESLPPPSLNQAWITYPEPAARFAEMLSAVGGRCLPADNVDDLNRQLRELPNYGNAARIASCVPGIADANVDVEAVHDPHDLADIDYAVLPGVLAVAESAAVWVTDEHVRHRVLYFIPQHLALVVPASQVVDNLHQAYQRIGRDRNFPHDMASDSQPRKFRFGTFISGPSKTADIEQSLVIGAHGARSLAVILLKDAPRGSRVPQQRMP